MTEATIDKQPVFPRGKHRLRRRYYFLVAILLFVLAYLTNSRILHPPAIELGCEYGEIAIPPAGAAILEAPPEFRSANGVFSHTLRAGYADHMIGKCKVHLRSYDGLLTAATWRVRPGDLLKIELKNEMRPGVPAAGAKMSAAMNHGNVNGTNLHTHGLHVSSAGNSDNPLINVQPGHSFDYEIRIPANHPPGTFWYHPHLHGGTAVQQSSGMSGALIVEGGLDEVPEIKAAKEQVLILQQITYDQTGKLEDLTRRSVRAAGAVRTA